jgi:uncharacterized damage-inducible protein DinB
MTPPEALLHLRYSGWASRKLMDAARALPSGDLNKPLGVSHGSLLGTLGHVYWADRLWCTRTADPSLDPLSEATWELLEHDWPLIQQKWEDWAAALDGDALAQAISFTGLNGKPYQMPAWQIVLHVVNHATLHRGQAMAMLRQLGVKPPATDLIFYYRELG